MSTAISPITLKPVDYEVRIHDGQGCVYKHTDDGFADLVVTEGLAMRLPQGGAYGIDGYVHADAASTRKAMLVVRSELWRVKHGLAEPFILTTQHQATKDSEYFEVRNPGRRVLALDDFVKEAKVLSFVDKCMKTLLNVVGVYNVTHEPVPVVYTDTAPGDIVQHSILRLSFNAQPSVRPNAKPPIENGLAYGCEEHEGAAVFDYLQAEGYITHYPKVILQDIGIVPTGKGFAKADELTQQSDLTEEMELDQVGSPERRARINESGEVFKVTRNGSFVHDVKGQRGRDPRTHAPCLMINDRADMLADDLIESALTGDRFKVIKSEAKVIRGAIYGYVAWYSDAPATTVVAAPTTSIVKADVFICHASEDKDAFVRPLANAIKAEGITVWYDEFSLKWGNSLAKTLDKGLAECKRAIVVVSPNFFALHKTWTKIELSALVGRYGDNDEDLLLPIFHNMTAKEVRAHSPILGGIIGIESTLGNDEIIRRLKECLSA